MERSEIEQERQHKKNSNNDKERDNDNDDKNNKKSVLNKASMSHRQDMMWRTRREQERLMERGNIRR